MGRMLAEVITQPEMSCELAAAIERPGSSLLGADMGELIGGDASGVVVTSDLASAADKIDVLIDFTVPEASMQWLTISQS